MNNYEFNKTLYPGHMKAINITKSYNNNAKIELNSTFVIYFGGLNASTYIYPEPYPTS